MGDKRNPYLIRHDHQLAASEPADVLVFVGVGVLKAKNLPDIRDFLVLHELVVPSLEGNNKVIASHDVETGKCLGATSFGEDEGAIFREFSSAGVIGVGQLGQTSPSGSDLVCAQDC